MHTTPLDSALDTVMLLNSEERDMLVNIVHGRQIEFHREELVRDVQEGLAEYRSGELQPQTAEEIIKELHESLDK